MDQKEHRQVFPRPGWVDTDAEEIWTNVQAVIKGALAKLKITAKDLAAVGITNQRETTVIWDKVTGKPVHNAIVWQDTRTDRLVRDLGGTRGQDRFRDLCRTACRWRIYFSGPKIRWLPDHVDGLRARAEAGEVLFGTMDSWVIWNLTGRHVTDVTNASRTMLMSLKTLDWDDSLLAAIGVPRAMLPEIRPSSEVYGDASGDLAGVPVASALGRPAAVALFGQTCFAPERRQEHLRHRQLPAGQHRRQAGALQERAPDHRRLQNRRPASGLRPGGLRSPVAGALVQWLRDNLGLISNASEIEALARTVEDNGGCYFVPAFSGLFAPYWQSDARGVIAGLTGYINKGHIARAVLEATAWQTRELVDAMTADSGVALTTLKVDGGMTANDLPHAVPGRCAGRVRRAPGGARDNLPGRRLRRRAGGGLLAGHRGPARELGGVGRMDARHAR